MVKKITFLVLQLLSSVCYASLWTRNESYTNTSQETEYSQTVTEPSTSLRTTDSWVNRENSLKQAQVILEETRKFCPYSSYCGAEPLQNNTNPSRTSCCQDCECDRFCGLRGDCCHQIYDLYKLKDKYNMSCISVKSNYSKLKMSKSYYMIDECFRQNDILSGGDNKLKKLHPVYSPATKLIYYNNYFAICNDVFDAINWTSFISCKMSSSLMPVQQIMLRGFQNGDCGVDFFPPPVMPEAHLRCYRSFIDQCLVGENISADSACRAVHSPVSVITDSGWLTFANVHCLLCNNYKYYPESCYPEDGRAAIGTLTLLIDFESLHDIIDRHIKKTPQEKTDIFVCGDGFIKHPQKEECRELLCPNGQYKINEECHFFSKSWRIWGALDLQLLMTPATDIPVKDLLLSQGQEIEVILRKSKLYWKHLEMLYSYSPDGNLTTINSVLVILGKETGKNLIDLVSLTDRIGKLLKTGFTIDVAGKLYTFNVRIDKGYLYRRDNGSQTTLTRTRPKSKYPVVEVYNLLSGERWDRPFALLPLIISKLYFCPLVRLRKEEYTREGEMITIFPNSTSTRRLFILEYLSWDNGYICVCAEDFNADRKTHRSHAMKFHLPHDLVVYMILLIIESPLL